MKYKTQSIGTSKTVWFDIEGIRVSFADPCPGNNEYEAYLAWLAEGNEPEIVQP